VITSSIWSCLNLGTRSQSSFFICVSILSGQAGKIQMLDLTERAHVCTWHISCPVLTRRVPAMDVAAEESSVH